MNSDDEGAKKKKKKVAAAVAPVRAPAPVAAPEAAPEAGASSEAGASHADSSAAVGASADAREAAESEVDVGGGVQWSAADEPARVLADAATAQAESGAFDVAAALFRRASAVLRPCARHAAAPVAPSGMPSSSSSSTR